MKCLRDYIGEKLIIKTNNTLTKTVVRTNKDLKLIIRERALKNVNELDLNYLDVSNISDFSNVFNAVVYQPFRSIKRIYIDTWDTSSAKFMNSMFNEMTALEEVDVSDFDVSGVDDMEYMFRRCISLKKLDLSQWDVSNVVDMEKIFYECEKLETVGDVSGWEPKKLQIFDYALNGCKILKEFDMSNWSTYFNQEHPTSYETFINCPNIQIPDWAER